MTEIARVADTVAAMGAEDWAKVGALLGLARLDARRLRGVLPGAGPDRDGRREAGALGARLTGGGFGGSVVSVVPEERAGALTTCPRRRVRRRRAERPST